MRPPADTIRIYEDRLVRRIHTKSGTLSIGKRVGKSCPLSRDEIRTYIKKGRIKCVKLIMEKNPGLSLRACVDKIRAASGEGKWRWM